MKEIPNKELFKDVKSCAIIPITIDKKVYGVLFLDKYHKCNFFVEDDLLVLKAFSNQAAIAIRNVNFFNKLQRVTETYPNISELNVDINKVLENIAKIAAEVLETDILVLYRYDKKNKKIIHPPIYNGDIYFSEYMHKEVGENDTPYLLLKGGENLYAENSQEDLILTPARNLMEGIPKRFVVREKIVSSAGILLRSGQEIVGIMFINYRTPHKFDEDERKIIDNYTSYIAIAIQNVKHYGEKEIISAFQTLGSLAAVVAHKIKNDIGTINLYAGDLMDDIDKNHPYFINVSQIKKQVHKITMDIDFLMNASKLKYPEKSDTNLIDIVNALGREMATELKEKNVKLEKNLISRLPKIKVDATQIKMVFSNLIYNSIAAMPGGGKIIISISTIENDVLLELEDTGCGISTEYAGKVFEPFWTTKGRGFGLGLFLSKTIIEEHGGSIALDANHKGGAKFIIKFPIKE